MKINTIFTHCSASDYGDVLLIDQWHKARGWSGIGYHFVILNGRPNSESYFEFLDGEIQPGRYFNNDQYFEPREIGAHVLGRNFDSLGICLIGRTFFTANQLISYKKLIKTLSDMYNIPTSEIKGHYEAEISHTNKTCPNMPMISIRKYLMDKIDLDEVMIHINKRIEELYPDI